MCCTPLRKTLSCGLNLTESYLRSPAVGTLVIGLFASRRDHGDIDPHFWLFATCLFVLGCGSRQRVEQ